MFAFRLLTILSPIEIKVLQSCDHLRQILGGCVGLWCRVNTALKETPSSFGLLALGPCFALLASLGANSLFDTVANPDIYS